MSFKFIYYIYQSVYINRTDLHVAKLIEAGQSHKF